jgi:hypothetical protein
MPPSVRSPLEKVTREPFRAGARVAVGPGLAVVSWPGDVVAAALGVALAGALAVALEVAIGGAVVGTLDGAVAPPQPIRPAVRATFATAIVQRITRRRLVAGVDACLAELRKSGFGGSRDGEYRFTAPISHRPPPTGTSSPFRSVTRVRRVTRDGKNWRG